MRGRSVIGSVRSLAAAAVSGLRAAGAGRQRAAGFSQPAAGLSQQTAGPHRQPAAGLSQQTPGPHRQPAAGISRQAAKPPRQRPGRPPPARLRSFDPVRVGGLEAAAWAAYYRREWGRLLVLSVWLVRVAFGMDWIRTIHGAWLVLRANQRWAPARNDPAAARRCMCRFYALLRLACGQPADPRRAARLELDWWAVHRAHRRGEDGGPGPLAEALARLNAYLYRTSEAAVRPAAQHRASAMDLSDEWAAAGCPDGSPLLAAVRAELVRSYAALLAAVHR